MRQSTSKAYYTLAGFPPDRSTAFPERTPRPSLQSWVIAHSHEVHP